MGGDLGARLVRAGLVTRRELSRLRKEGATDEPTLAQALVAEGLSEDALAGFFLSEGYGPLVELGRAPEIEDELLDALPPRRAKALCALPLRRDRDGLRVAMAIPSDAAAREEIRLLYGTDLVACTARLSDLRTFLERAYLDEDEVELAAPEVAREREEDEEDDVLDLLSEAMAERLVEPLPPDRAPTRSRETIDGVVLPLVRPKTDAPGNQGAPSPGEGIEEEEPPTSEISRSHLRSTANRAPEEPEAAESADTLPELMPIDGLLEAMGEATDRDEMIALACEAALTVSRAALFLAFRKRILRGWVGRGPDLYPEEVRDLVLPLATSPIFRSVARDGQAYLGPYGESEAERLLAEAIGGEARRMAAAPVIVEEKVIGVLLLDAPRPGPESVTRLARLAEALSAGLLEVIVRQKRGA